jgi:hypothetical protein
MALEQMLTKLLSWNHINSVLVCEAGLTELRAAVIEKKKDKLIVSPEVMVSDAPDYPSAIAEIVRKAKVKGWAGKHAILLTPAALTSPILLPIPHKHKVPLLQFEEAVRWELDPLMQQQKQTLLLGQILVANRSITPDHLSKLLEEQTGMDRSKNREVVYKRIGELAIERGHLTPNRLEQAIARQHWFMDEEDDIKCDWHPIKHSTDVAPGAFPWLAAGINKAVLRKWQAGFAQQAIKLEACYPLAGAALGAPDLASQVATGKGKPSSEVILELHNNTVSAELIVNGALSQLVTTNCHAANRLMQISELYHQLGDASWQRVSLLDTTSKSEQEASILNEDLAELINLPVDPIKQPARTCGLSMIGAVSHIMGVQRASNVQGVSVHEPLPPLMQRFGVRAILTIFGLILALIIAELGIFGRQAWIDYQNHLIADDLAKVHQAQKEIQDNIDRVKALQSQLKTLEDEKKSLKNIQQLFGEKLPQRNDTLQAFLKAFETTVDDDVVIDKLIEDGIRGFSVSAWALNEAAAQNFIKRFQLAVHPLGYRLKEITVSQQTGRLGMIGNSIVFNATQLDDDKWEASKLLPTRTPVIRR